MLIDRNAVIEHKTLALEALLRELFEIREDTAFKLIDVFVPLRFHRDDRLLAPDATGAVHQYFFVFGNARLLHVRGKIGEVLDRRIDRPAELTDRDFR
jgi:hypothetical protein